MAYFYTSEEMQEALKEIRVKPFQGTVTSREAAKILTWRAKNEFGIDRTYDVSAVRRHISLGNLKSVQPEKYMNRYNVEDVFELPITPRRGYKGPNGDEPLADVA